MKHEKKKWDPHALASSGATWRMGWNAPSAKLMNYIIVGRVADMSEGRAAIQRDLDRLRKQTHKPHTAQRQISSAPEME